MRKAGFHLSEDHKRKISQSNKGKKRSLESRQRMSKSHTGKQISDEAREKISVANKGKKRSPESCKNISNGRKGMKFSEEHCRNISKSKSGKNHPMYGKHPSEEAIRKSSEARKGKKRSKEFCLRMSQFKGEKSSNWRGGVSFEPYCNKFDNPFKERCRKFFGRICVECGKNEADNSKRLDVHHVNFDKQTCCNDNKPLYVALCHSCHQKTQHNREYWEKHFTEIINTKYNGQCYLPKEEKS